MEIFYGLLLQLASFSLQRNSWLHQNEPCNQTYPFKYKVSQKVGRLYLFAGAKGLTFYVMSQVKLFSLSEWKALFYLEQKTKILDTNFCSTVWSITSPNFCNLICEESFGHWSCNSSIIAILDGDFMHYLAYFVGFTCRHLSLRNSCYNICWTWYFMIVFWCLLSSIF